MTLESNLQQKVLQLFKHHNILAIKVETKSKRGWPDVEALYPSGTTIYIETKTPRGRLSVHQMHIHEEIRQRKGIVYVINNIEDAQKLLTAH